MTVRTAPSIVSNGHTAAEIASGRPYSRSVTSVMTPSVPSEPTNSRVKSYPDDDFRARPPVWITRPSASTTVRPSTTSRMVPYRTAVVPDARVAAMPPIVASAPGSTEKWTPLFGERLVQLSMGDAGFDLTVQVFDADAQNAVHPGQIDGDRRPQSR